MKTRWLVALLMTVASLPVLGQSLLQDRFEITARQVALTLLDRGIQVTDERVSLVAKVVANGPHPVLDILSIAPLIDDHASSSESHSRVKLACHLAGTCLPFYAVISWPNKTVREETKTPNTSPAIRNTVFKSDSVVTMRVGAHATLMMDDDRAHIQIAVISLENGIAGHRIRVASPDHKQFYFAEVVSASQLKGRF